jgi:hypothetical protein
MEELEAIPLRVDALEDRWLVAVRLIVLANVTLELLFGRLEEMERLEGFAVDEATRELTTTGAVPVDK